MNFNTSANDVISVSSLNRMARDLLESGLPPMWIGGEISNLTLAASGHAYFSLKDGGAQIRCVMFRHKLSLLPFRLAEGMQVELKGLVTLYEARGDFQINVDTMRSAGLGRLYEAFEKLKVKLNAEGLFEQARKRALPAHPRAIGIVTSPAPRHCAMSSPPWRGACQASRSSSTRHRYRGKARPGKLPRPSSKLRPDRKWTC